MHAYGVSDVERVLRLPRSTIRSLVTRGFVSPSRGPRREYRFSFQDLIVLRTARALTLAKVPPKRIHRSLRELRRSLPDVMPLSGLTICAVGDQVVVREGTKRWRADSGQYLLDLDVSVTEGKLHIVDRKPAPAQKPANGEDLFEKALELENTDPVAACKVYEECLAADPTHLSARINLGRLLHEAGRVAEAEQLYRSAPGAGAKDPTLNFNLGVLLEDSGRDEEAVQAYQRAVASDPAYADAHFNLGRLFERLGRRQEAIRHLICYRKLRKPS
jgi:DNA-binding transcriptional MerR regulator